MCRDMAERLIDLMLNHGIMSVIAWSLLLAVVIPMAIIVRRTGHSLWWVILLFVPLGGFVALWLLALARWPALREG